MTEWLDLVDKMKGASAPFKPCAFYVPEGDVLQIHTRNVASIARRVDDVLTVYEGLVDQDLAGCAIKGVRCLVRKFGNRFGLKVLKNGKVRASIVLLAYIADKPQAEEPKDRLSDLMEATENLELELAGI